MELDKLSLEEKIGQRFIFGINSHNIDGIIKLIKEAHIGGVVLYKKNYDSYQQMLAVIKKLKEANMDNKIPLFIAIDQEGGRVNRMPNQIHLIKNNYDISKNGIELVNDSANIVGKMLRETGINMNLEPVMDIYNNSKSKVLYKRCFYGGVDSVTKYGNTYVKTLNNNGIISVIKHFPGHGSSKIDSHFFIPYIFDYNNLLESHMRPFEEAIKNGTDAIMVGHLIVRGLTGLLPASISDRFIRKYLREKNKFNGLIITDEINMLKRHVFYTFSYLNMALKSSNDILLIKINGVNEGYKIINRYKKLLLNDNLSSKLDESVIRIIETKKKYKINDDINFSGCDVDEVNREIDDINMKIIQ